MVTRILILVLIGALLLAGLLWLFTGGLSGIISFVRTVPNPIDIIWGDDAREYKVRLPWELEAPRGPDISGLTGVSDEGGAHVSEELRSLEGRYRELETQAEESEKFGAPSSLRGQVRLSIGSARERDVRAEYLEISVREDVSLAGWSVQSVLSGVRVFLPPAVSPLPSQGGNARVVVLEAGERAIISSGPSPLGVSFQENACTGYLGEGRTFTPSLEQSCPSATELAPLTIDTLQYYGSQCIDYARTLPSCTTPSSLPSSLTPGCRAYIAETFSYAGCVRKLGGFPSFDSPMWRLYLNSSVQFWDDAHDVIRLLDARGLTVDAVSY